jgi:hypothetical protein
MMRLGVPMMRLDLRHQSASDELRELIGRHAWIGGQLNRRHPDPPPSPTKQRRPHLAEATSNRKGLSWRQVGWDVVWFQSKMSQRRFENCGCGWFGHFAGQMKSKTAQSTTGS